MNVVVVEGSLSRAPEERTLPSGDRLLALEVSVPGPDRVESVPVVWPDPPTRRATLDAGAPVVVVGRVRRRFFRAGGATQSRTEVVARVVVPGGARKRVRSAIDQACGELAGDRS